MNLHQAMQVIVNTHLAALRENVRANSIEMVSGPGVGKSSIMSQSCTALARALGEPVGRTSTMAATIQSIDVRGFMLPVKAPDGSIRPHTVFSVPPWYPTQANMWVYLPDGTVTLPGMWTGELPRVGLCDLDEFGQSEDDVRKALAQLLLHGEVGTDRLPIGWRVIAASNRMTDRAGVVRPLTFLTNRRMEIKIDAHLPTWSDWVNSLPDGQRPHHFTVSFANRNPDLVFRDAVPPGNDPFCTPRTLVLMDKDLRALRSQEDIAKDRLPTDPIAREVCAGWIGGGEGAQFFTHIKFADALPDIEDIEKDPMRAKLPPQRDAQMVCAFFLAHHLNEDNPKSIMIYMNRLNVDMQVLAMRTITQQTERARLVANTAEFSNWLLKHKDLLIASHS